MKIDQAFEELSSMTILCDNWDGYGAPAPADTALDNAWRFLNLCESRALSPVTVSPAQNGSVSLVFQQDSHVVDLEFDQRNAVHITLARADGQHSTLASGMGQEQLLLVLSRLREYLGRGT